MRFFPPPWGLPDPDKTIQPDGDVVLPAAGDVRVGVDFGADAQQTGELDPESDNPDPADVRSGVPVGQAVGTCAVPAAAEVKAGVAVDDAVGTYPTTEASQAAQLAADVALLNGMVNSIPNGLVLLPGADAGLLVAGQIAAIAGASVTLRDLVGVGGGIDIVIDTTGHAITIDGAAAVVGDLAEGMAATWDGATLAARRAVVRLMYDGATGHLRAYSQAADVVIGDPGAAVSLRLPHATRVRVLNGTAMTWTTWVISQAVNLQLVEVARTVDNLTTLTITGAALTAETVSDLLARCDARAGAGLTANLSGQTPPVRYTDLTAAGQAAYDSLVTVKGNTITLDA